MKLYDKYLFNKLKSIKKNNNIDNILSEIEEVLN